MNVIKLIVLLFQITIFIVNLASAGSNFRIIGGNSSTIENHPWMVSIQFLRVHFCGGSIISENIIITAAHCFDDQISGLTITAGTADLTEVGTTIRVESVLIHQNYNQETFNYDIAILQLSENLTFSNEIYPISLPEQDSEIPDGTPVVTSGWGITEEGGTETSNILLDIEIYTVSWEICKSKLADDNEVTINMICAGYSKGGRDTCQSDSGGALELNGTLIGIVSWGHGCGEADYPGVYSHVGRFRSWIKQHTGI